MSLDRSLSLKRSRTSATCCWIKLITIRCGGAIPGRVAILQVRNVGLSHRGVGGMIFGPIPTIFSHWFKKRRSSAFAISATGSSLGETVILIVSSQRIDLIGCVKSIRINEHYRRGFSGSTGQYESLH